MPRARREDGLTSKNAPSDNASEVKQYLATVTAANYVASPYTARRNLLLIQNTGANQLNIRFGSPAFGGNDEFQLASGDRLPFTDTVPVQSLNLYAPNGDTTVCIIEGLEP